MSEAYTYIPKHDPTAPPIPEKWEEIGGLVEVTQKGDPSLRNYKLVDNTGQMGTADAAVVSHMQNPFPANTLNEKVWIAQRADQEKTITLADEKSVEVKLPPNDSDTIRRLFVSLDEDDEHGDGSESVSEELIRLIESLGKPALDFLGKLIEDSASYTNAFLGLELLGFIEQKSTLSDRVDIGIRMLSNRSAPVRHAAISVIAALRAEEALTPLESLVHSDCSTLNRKLAQRAIDKIVAYKNR